MWHRFLKLQLLETAEKPGLDRRVLSKSLVCLSASVIESLVYHNVAAETLQNPDWMDSVDSEAT